MVTAWTSPRSKLWNWWCSLGTGVPFHFHGPVFAEIIYGSKRWFLYPFEERPEFEPDHSTLEW
ncbi:unnamed protein product [Strongylus vulgaris]|uniref:Uncharacterized protein n=1 Tax=Strongylus vulgaris TaxID=40348 RepID=A0A3P7IRE0_STRVU|nr:unnamed protein product [Strongylus vulgaris]